MSILTIVGIDVIPLIVLLMLSVPLPYCFGGALLFMSLFGGVSMKSMMLWAYSQSIGTVLLASPLFILAGTYMGGSGVAKKLLDLCDAFIGRIKGGLGVVSVVTCAIIGATSGSGFTGVAATGPIMIPRMVEQGYPRGFATALVTVSSVLGLLIPPSAIMIIYGWITETSILACFLSTVGPGLLVMLLFCIINLLECKKFDLSLMPSMPIREKVSVTGKRFVSAIPALMMPVIILGGIYGGVFTPTEAAAVAVLYSIPVGLWIYKAMKLRDLKKMTFDSICSIGSIMVMIVFCLMYTSIQTGVVDGAIGAGAEMYYGNLSGLVKYYLPINDHFEQWYMYINTDKWNSLSDSQRSALTTAGQHMQEKRWEVAPEETAEYEKKLTDSGTVIVKYTDEQIQAFADKIRKNVWPIIEEEYGTENFEAVTNSIK